MKPKPIYSAACPCCASTLVNLVGVHSAELWTPRGVRECLIGPIAWHCAFCGFAMMGLAVPIRPELYANTSAGQHRSCLEARGITEIVEGGSATTCVAGEFYWVRGRGVCRYAYFTGQVSHVVNPYSFEGDEWRGDLYVDGCDILRPASDEDKAMYRNNVRERLGG